MRKLKRQLYAGERFGRLVVVEHRGEKARCLCDCGKDVARIAWKLISGHTKSCGCLRRDMSAARMTDHGLTGTPEHNSWRGIIQRCENPNCEDYVNYGARGIRMCPWWRKSFVNFLADVGKRPSPRYTIGRKNNNGHYEPGNVEWSEYEAQARNRRDSVILEHNGKRMNLIAWAHRLGMKQPTLWKRLNRLGWSVKEALDTPVREFLVK